MSAFLFDFNEIGFSDQVKYVWAFLQTSLPPGTLAQDCTIISQCFAWCLQIDLLLAKAAVKAGDWSAATEYVEHLAQEGYAPAWHTALAVLRGTPVMESSSQDRLVAFAVAHCGLDDVSHSLDLASRSFTPCNHIADNPALQEVDTSIAIHCILSMLGCDVSSRNSRALAQLSQDVAPALQMAELMDRMAAPQQTADTAMVRQLALRAIQGFPGIEKGSNGYAEQAGLPDLGDVTLAQAALLAIPVPEAADLLHSFAQQKQSYAESRRLALLGLSTFALQVWHRR